MCFSFWSLEYSKDIVYGCPGTFQGDLLKHEFELQKTRGDRQYDIVIVDEVDNMLIDDARHITMLSGPMPGFEYLLGLLLNCWNILIKFDQRFEVRDGKLIWINEDFKNEDGKLLTVVEKLTCLLNKIFSINYPCLKICQMEWTIK